VACDGAIVGGASERANDAVEWKGKRMMSPTYLVVGSLGMLKLTKYRREWTDRSDIGSTIWVLSKRIEVQISLYVHYPEWISLSDEKHTPPERGNRRICPPKCCEARPLSDQSHSRLEHKGGPCK